MTKITCIEVPVKFRTLFSAVCTSMVFVGIYLSLGTTSALAFGAAELPLVEKVEKSDVVIVGQVDRIETQRVDAGGDLKGIIYDAKTALVLVTATLKGEPAKKIRVDYTGPFPEDDPPCCEIGNSYVFFLKRAGDNTYSLIDLNYGIHPIDPVSHGGSLNAK